MRIRYALAGAGAALLATLGVIGAAGFTRSNGAGEPSGSASSLGANAPSETPDKATPGTGVSASASWVKKYESIAELASDVPLVVVGQVTGLSKLSPTPPSRPADGLVFSDFDVIVEQVLKGDRREREVVVIHQTGGTYGDGTRMALDDDPLLEVGTRYLLFLKRDPASGTYFVAGGPQGRLVADGDRVTSLSAVYPGRPIGDLQILGRPFTEVAAEVRAASR